MRLPVHVLSVADVEHLMNQAKVNTAWGVRDRAILEVLYSTGVRRSELAALAVFDWDRSRGAITVRQGKGGRDRVVPIGDRAAAWLGTSTKCGPLLAASLMTALSSSPTMASPSRRTGSGTSCAATSTTPA
jgi:site-specific recombinase XerD